MRNAIENIRGMKRRDKLLCAAVTLLFAALYIYWLITRADGAAQAIAAFICAALFCAICCAVIPNATLALVSGSSAPAALERGETRGRAWLRITLWMLASRIVLFLTAYAFFCILNGTGLSIFESLEPTWRMGLGIDAPSYLGIAENGYVTAGDAMYHLVFLPGFPSLIKLFSLLTGEYLTASFIAANVCAFAAAIVAYELAALELPHRDALRAVKYLFVFPSAFFFCMPMTESQFLLLCLLCAYFIRRERWLAAGLFGMLAAFTRLQGILLCVLAGYELLCAWRRSGGKKRAASAACVLLILCGMGGYLLVNYVVWGEPLKFMQLQAEHWSNHFNLFFDTAAYHTSNALGALREGDTEHLLGLNLPNLLAIFGSLALMLAGAKKLRASYVIFFLAYFVVSIGTTWLLSAPRYMLAAFPLAFAAVAITRTRTADAALTAAYIAFLLAYQFLFVAGAYVY